MLHIQTLKLDFTKASFRCDLTYLTYALLLPVSLPLFLQVFSAAESCDYRPLDSIQLYPELLPPSSSSDT